MSASFVPDHKASMVLFLDRVYGIDNQDFLLHVLEVGFLPDMRAAASLDTVSSATQRAKTVCVNISEISGCLIVALSDFRWPSAQPKWPWLWTATSAQLFCLCSPSVPHCSLVQTIVPLWSTPCSTPFTACPVAEPWPRLREMSSRSAWCRSASQYQ